jgi:hypothetical protein
MDASRETPPCLWHRIRPHYAQTPVGSADARRRITEFVRTADLVTRVTRASLASGPRQVRNQLQCQLQARAPLAPTAPTAAFEFRPRHIRAQESQLTCRAGINMCLAFIHGPRLTPRHRPRHHPRQIARRCLPRAWRNAHSTRPASRPRPRIRPAPMRRRNVGSASTTLTVRHRGMGGRWRRREDCFLGPPRPPPFLVAQVGGSTRAPTPPGTMTGYATMAGQDLSTTPVLQARTAPIAAEASRPRLRHPRLRHPRHHPRRPHPHRRPRLRCPRHRLRRPVQTAPIR